MPTDAQELATAIARMNRRLRNERRSELTPTQLSVLGTLRKGGPQTPGAVAAREGVRPPSMTRTLNFLIEEGLADKEPHPTDGRQVLVSTSAQGEKVLAVERDRRDQWLAGRLDALDPADRETLRRATSVLERLACE